MNILIDENIPYGREAFEALGTVETAPGRGITREMLLDKDILLVRSITKVDEALLAGTPVKFVATATIGEDHIDKFWLRAQGIGFSSAPGCNANSVSEYITAALLVLAERHGLSVPDLSLGIIGVGNVGRRVLKKAVALGMRCVLNDPPLAESTCEPVYRPIDEILACDIVTLHVPLERAGLWPTWHMVDSQFIQKMKSGSILLNTSRGAVANNTAVLEALRSGHLKAAVLDVWEGEPRYQSDVLRAVDIATPHIAGYSFDGKVNGTAQIYQAACRHFRLPATWDPAALLPAPEVPELDLSTSKTPVSSAVSAVYDILGDDKRLRATAGLADEERGRAFDLLRKEYPRRREFHNTRVGLGTDQQHLAAQLAGLGFQIES
jgi:erythronate-4-phosphate dehydrogenase